MKLFFIVVVILECLALAGLTIWKKWTRRTFLGVAGVTAVCCGIMGIMGLMQNAVKAEIDQRAYVYMTSRLLEENYYPASLETLAVVEDDGVGDLEIPTLRALSYNLNGAYETAASCLEESDSQTGQAVLEASQNRQPVAEEEKMSIAQSALEQVNASEAEIRQWEAEMKVRFMGFDLTEEEQTELRDEWALAKDAISKGQVETAYNLLAKKSDVKNAVIVSNMYVKNYNQRVMSDTDKEYAQLWEEAASLQADLNLASITMSQAEKTSDESVEEYQKIQAKYELAQDALSQESIKRAINYLLAFENSPEAASPGYRLQLARLYFMSNQLEEAEKYLDAIFGEDAISSDQWLGTDVEAFRQAYILYLSTPTSQESSILFGQLMTSLYQGLFDSDSYQTFQEFVFAYLQDLYGGLIIRTVDRSQFPTITADISCTKPELEVTEKTLSITDTGEKIEDFQLETSEISDLNLSLVMDISGSMEGQPLADSKNAIKNCIRQLSDNVSMNLVTFESTASLECSLSQSKYLVMNLVESAQTTGGTNIAAGLSTAVDSLKAASGARVVILLSDGYDGDDSRLQIQSAIAQAIASQVTVYTIGLEGCDQQYLQNIASATGGQFIMAVNTAQLDQIYQEIQTSLMKSYRITYEATGEEESRSLYLQSTKTADQAGKLYSLREEESALPSGVYEVQTADYFKQTGGTENGR